MLDDFSRSEPTEAPGALMADATRKTEQEAGREQIARARGIDDFFDRKSRHGRNPFL